MGASASAAAGADHAASSKSDPRRGRGGYGVVLSSVYGSVSNTYQSVARSVGLAEEEKKERPKTPPPAAVEEEEWDPDAEDPDYVVPTFAEEEEDDDGEGGAGTGDPLNQEADREAEEKIKARLAYEFRRIKTVKKAQTRRHLEGLLRDSPEWFDEDYRVAVISHRVQLTRGVCTYHVRRPKIKVKEDNGTRSRAELERLRRERQEKQMRRLGSRAELAKKRKEIVTNDYEDADLRGHRMMEGQGGSEEEASSSSTSYVTGDSEDTESDMLSDLDAVAEANMTGAYRADRRRRLREGKAARRAERERAERDRLAREKAEAEERRRQQEDIKRLAEHRERVTQRLKEREAARRANEEKRRAAALKKKQDLERGVFGGDGDDDEEGEDEEEGAPAGKLRGGGQAADERQRRLRQRRLQSGRAASVQKRAPQPESSSSSSSSAPASDDDDGGGGGDDDDGSEEERRFERRFDANFVEEAPLPPNVMVVPRDGVTKYEQRRKIRGLPPHNPDNAAPPALPYVRPGQEDVVVLLHSATGYSYEFHELGSALVRHGYTVVTFDFYGHGGTDWPSSEWDKNLRSTVDLLVEQTDELLTFLGYIDSEPDDTLPGALHNRDIFTFSVVGFDLGATVAAAYADYRPREVDRLVLMAPLSVPHPVTCGECWSSTFVCLGTSENSVIGKQRRNVADRDRGVAFIERMEEEVTWQLRNTHNYRRAVGLLRRDIPRAAPEIWGRAAADARPVLVCWGSEDAVTPYSRAAALLDSMPKARLVTAEGAGHHVLWEGFDQVTPALLDFLHVSGAGGAGEDESDYEEERGLLGAMEEAAQDELMLGAADGGQRKGRKRKMSKARAMARSRSRAMSFGSLHAASKAGGGGGVDADIDGDEDGDEEVEEEDEEDSAGILVALAAAASIGAGPGAKSSLASDMLRTRSARAGTVAGRTTDNLLTHMKRRGSRHAGVAAADAAQPATRARSKSRMDVMERDALADTDDSESEYSELVYTTQPQPAEEEKKAEAEEEEEEAYPETAEEARRREEEDVAAVGGTEELVPEDDTKALADDLAFVQKRLRREKRKEKARLKRRQAIRVKAARATAKAKAAAEEEEKKKKKGAAEEQEEAKTRHDATATEADADVLRNEYDG